MANKMLIDASHQEETRVVVVRGNRIEEFDFESQHKKQLKGNIYLAKITRVEPSLQAAFVEYGGNRHGFLAFSEIHPDYYQIPKADRQALIEEELARAQEDEEQEERSIRPKKSKSEGSRSKAARRDSEESVSEPAPEAAAEAEDRDADNGAESTAEEVTAEEPADQPASIAETAAEDVASEPSDAFSAPEGESASEAAVEGSEGAEGDVVESEAEATPAEFSSTEEASEEADEPPARRTRGRSGGRRGRGRAKPEESEEEAAEEPEEIDDLGSEDAMEEVPVRQSRPRKQYKIQEVIKRRQILLVQVVKEERGNKGAALTTYLSLAGRYSVLMPNTARGGGISRKITNVADRKRLKDVVRDLEVPRGMGIILRTAGAMRTKAEVKRDYEYLMRLWETVRNLTLTSMAPALVYEEGSLIKRSIRDLYNKDIDQILVSGEAGYREAKDFMRMLMPSQAKVVQPYRDPTPIFARQGIESQLDKMLHPHVTLKSGGYIIINQTEALVSIDVNSGRSTREHSIEDTALQTNLEAAEEVARQLRLRDLAGLIVIDFIDMEEKRNNRAVEKKLKDCLKDDRARIQVGRISHFGLLEMSRQRIRASVLESTMQTCPVCEGAGMIRSSSSLALHVLRTIEEHLQKHSSHDVIVKVPTATALYVLNEKRKTIGELERLHDLRIIIEAEDMGGHQHVRIEQGPEAIKREKPIEAVSFETISAPEVEIEEIEDEAIAEEQPEDAGERIDEPRGEGNGKRRRRRRRRGGRDERSDDESGVEASSVNATGEDDEDEDSADGAVSAEGEAEGEDESGRGRNKRRRRGRRGGRRGGREDDVVVADEAALEGLSATDEPLHETAVEDTLAEILPAAPAEIVSGETVAEEVVVEPAAGVEPMPSEEAEDSAPAAEAPETAVETQASEPAEEPAVAANDDHVEEAPRPVLTEPLVTSSSAPGEGGEEKPRRSGWWSRRGFL